MYVMLYVLDADYQGQNQSCPTTRGAFELSAWPTCAFWGCPSASRRPHPSRSQRQHRTVPAKAGCASAAVLGAQHGADMKRQQILPESILARAKVFGWLVRCCYCFCPHIATTDQRADHKNKTRANLAGVCKPANAHMHASLLTFQLNDE